MSSSYPSGASPFVTHGSTPLCDACGSHYSERHCEDCGQFQCSWCNLRAHESIGARNHHRPRLYGEDPYAHLEANPPSTAERILAEHARAAGGGRGSSAGNGAASARNLGAHHFDSTTGRVTVTTEHALSVAAEDAWDVLGDFDAPFVPNGVDANDAMDRRTLRLRVPAAARGADDEEEEAEQQSVEVQVTENLLQRDERDMWYSYSRLLPPSAAPLLPYTDLMARFAFAPLPPAPNGGGKRCVLQWTASVVPREGVEPREAAEAVQREHQTWLPYMDAAIQMEE